MSAPSEQSSFYAKDRKAWLKWLLKNATKENLFGLLFIENPPERRALITRRL